MRTYPFLLQSFVFTCLLCVCFCPAKAQEFGANDTITTAAVIYDGEIIEARTLEELRLYARLTPQQMREREAYNRLRNAVYVTYPYARRAGILLNDINLHLEGVTDKDKRKAYIKSREKELKQEFTSRITDLSVYQGKVLMKLINRETGNNCYEIIKEYKGGVQARFYQTIAFFFDSNLKQQYDAQNGDEQIEFFVREVQRMYGIYDLPKPKMRVAMVK